MRNALVLLDRYEAKVAACHLQMAIDVAEATRPVRTDETVNPWVASGAIPDWQRSKN